MPPRKADRKGPRSALDPTTWYPAPIVRVNVLPLLVLLVLARGATAGEDGEDVVGPVPWRADAETVFLRRIVESATGRPVEGATVKLHCEKPHPVPDFGTPSASATSGPDGWVRIRKGDVDPKITARYGGPTWAYVEAMGLAPDASYQDFTRSDPDWPLVPATTIRVALRDPLDRPVANAQVGLLLGCGHTPDVRQTRTGPDGVATIERVARLDRHFGQIWPVADGLKSSYVEDDSWARWERPTTARLGWGQIFEGTILTHDGKPAVGVAVGNPSYHRGPWTLTDAEGRFRLVGVHAQCDDLLVETAEYTVGPHKAKSSGTLTVLSFDTPPPGHRTVLRLPAPGEEPDDERPAEKLVVELGRAGWPEGHKGATVEVMAVRGEDGWTQRRGDYDEPGVVKFDVKPGAYEVCAFGRNGLSSIVYSTARTNVVVKTGEGTRVRLPLPAPALLPLVFAPAQGRAETLLAEGESQPVDVGPDGGTIEVLVPVDRPVFLQIVQESRRRMFPMDKATLKSGQRATAMKVPTFDPVEIRARFVDAEGNATEGWLSEASSEVESDDPPEGDAKAEPTLTVLAGDHLTLIAWPKDVVRFQPSFLEVPSAVADGKPLDLGAVRLAPRSPALTFEGADGAPLAGAEIVVTNGDRSEQFAVEERAPAGQFTDPWYAPGLLATGAVVRSSGWERHGSASSDARTVPFVRRLEGPGPWRLRQPAGRITISPAREDAAPLASWVVYFDGTKYESSGGSLELRGVEAGEHEIVVDCTDCVPMRLVLTLVAKDAHVWAPRLRVAPPR